MPGLLDPVAVRRGLLAQEMSHQPMQIPPEAQWASDWAAKALSGGYPRENLDRWMGLIEGAMRGDPQAIQGGVEEIMPGPDLGGLLGMVKPLSGRASLIKDWKWRPMREVQEGLGITDLPEHIRPFGRFMRDQAGKASKGEITSRDLVKSFTVTRASIQRSAVDAEKVRPDIRWAAEGEKVRPEDAFSAWLFTEKGQRYLNAAESGKIDEEAISDAVAIMAPFGRHTTDIPSALRWAAENMAGRSAEANNLISKASAGKSPRNDWYKFTSDLPGIGPSKAGFFASMLGRGDIPTLDARQLQINAPATKASASKYMRRGGGEGGTQATERLAKRLEAMDIFMDKEFEPFRSHLTHHAMWDVSGNTETTHDAIIKAMTLAGVGGVGIGLLDSQRTD